MRGICMGGKGSGRRTKLEKLKDTRTILSGAAPHAAAYLRDVIRRKVKRPSNARIEVARYIIDHEIGKPPQRHEIAGVGGTPLTLLELCLAAQRVGIMPADTPQIPEGNGGGDDVIDGVGKVIEDPETPKEPQKEPKTDTLT